MKESKPAPLRAHDWLFSNGYLVRNAEPKHSVKLTPAQQRMRTIRDKQRASETVIPVIPAAKAPIIQPAPIAQKTYPQRDDTASKVAALMRQGYSFSAAMDAAVEGAPLNQKLYKAATKLNDTLGRIKNKAASVIDGQKEGNTDVA